VANQSQAVKPEESDPISDFFLDDKSNLKSVFDNVRNYIICATLFAISSWFKRGDTEGILIGLPMSQFYAYCFLTIAIVLTVLNLVQTYAILVPPYLELTHQVNVRAEKASPRWKWLADIVDAFVESIGTPFVLIVLLLIIYLIVVLYIGTSVEPR